MDVAISIVVTFLLTLVNGYFSASEMAVVNAKRAVLEPEADEGDKRAKSALDLSSDSGQFLATIQVAITLVGFASSAFAATSLSDPLGSWFVSLGMPAGIAATLAPVIITLVVAYFSTVVGELVPKRIALSDAERVSKSVAGPIRAFMHVAAPLVWLTSKSADGLSKVMGIKSADERQNVSEEERRTKYPSLEEVMPTVYKELDEIQRHLEQYFKDMQDIEFTIQDGKLWMLQCRNGKRTGAAMVKIAMDMLREGLIDERTAVLRCEPAKLDELLHPVFDKKAIANAQVITKGLPASPGAATGPVVFFAEDAEKILAESGQKAILVRIETSPEDLKGMLDAAGILTARGGMTSHAAVVARGMGKCCVSGAGELEIDYKTRTIRVNGFTVKEGDWISLNGSTGEVYLGQVATMAADLSGDFGQLMELAGKYAVLKVRANADTPKDALQAFAFGAEGIGLCRTEHMFFEGDRIKAIREMILADDEAGRRVALAKLLPIQRGDFEGLFKAMNGFPVTVRLLDPPLHEFVPHDEKGQQEMAKEMNVPLQKIVAKVESLAEFNPMLGHRGCRLGNTYPEITEMQARAIIEAAMNVKAQGIPVHVEIMVPLVGNHKELRYQKGIIDATAEQVFSERNDKIDYMVGTMIEVPRAAVTANQIAEVAEFFSFGTNDLTQMTLGFSRDDIGKFLPVYLEKGILKNDPFQILDRNGVGQLIREAVFKGRSTREKLKCGICGEHGGEPSSVEFCHYAGLNYVSCSPFRVPIARLAAAHAALNEK